MLHKFHLFLAEFVKLFLFGNKSKVESGAEKHGAEKHSAEQFHTLSKTLLAAPSIDFTAFTEKVLKHMHLEHADLFTLPVK